VVVDFLSGRLQLGLAASEGQFVSNLRRNVGLVLCFSLHRPRGRSSAGQGCGLRMASALCLSPPHPRRRGTISGRGVRISMFDSLPPLERFVPLGNSHPRSTFWRLTVFLRSILRFVFAPTPTWIQGAPRAAGWRPTRRDCSGQGFLDTEAGVMW